MQLLPLTTEALNNINQYKDHCTEKQYTVITEALKGHDLNLRGAGYSAIAAKAKLKALKEIDFLGFLESLKYI